MENFDALKRRKLDNIIVEKIIDLESRNDPFDGDMYLDEGEQAELNVLFELLDRELTDDELNRITQLRKME